MVISSGERPDYRADLLLASWFQSMDLDTSCPSVMLMRTTSGELS